MDATHLVVGDQVVDKGGAVILPIWVRVRAIVGDVQEVAEEGRDELGVRREAEVPWTPLVKEGERAASLWVVVVWELD